MSLIKVAKLEPLNFKRSGYIEAYVKLKSNIKVTKNGKRYFVMILWDDSDEIKATIYGVFCDEYHGVLQVNKKYRLGDGFLGLAKNTNLTHAYEIVFQNSISVEECIDNTTAPAWLYNFTSLADVLTGNDKIFVDIVGIIVAVGELQERNSKRSRTICLIDDSNAKIDLVLWDDEAQSFDERANLHQVVMLKDAWVKNYDGKNCVHSKDFLFINPDVTRANDLKYWYIVVKEKWVTIYDVVRAESKEAICLGTVTEVSANSHVYKACVNCGTKMESLEGNSTLYKCTKCRNQFTKYTKGLVLKMKIADPTDELHISAFGDVAERMLDKKTNDLCTSALENDEEYSRFLQKVQFQSFVFHLRRKDDEAVVVDARPMNCKEVATRIIANVRANKFGSILK